MKVLGISGSPRIGGNTDILLDEALKGAESRGAETEKIVLNSLKFFPCQECEGLRDDGSCIVEDDMQAVYGKIDDADALILASPIFFASVSAQAKMMIDRFQCVWRAKRILKRDIFNKRKKGGFISVEGSEKREFFGNAKSIVKNLFATIDVEYTEELFCPGIDEKGSILKRPDFLEKAFRLGSNLASAA